MTSSQAPQYVVCFSSYYLACFVLPPSVCFVLPAMKKSVSFFRMRRRSPALALVEVADEDHPLSSRPSPAAESLEATSAEEKIWATYEYDNPDVRVHPVVDNAKAATKEENAAEEDPVLSHINAVDDVMNNMTNRSKSSHYDPRQFENTRPAPRPPQERQLAERPRLALMPSTSGPGNMSQTNLSSPASSRIDISSPPMSRSTTLGSGENFVTNGVTIIKEGPTRCKELLRHVERWLILRKYNLDVLAKQGGKVMMTIAFKDVTGVSRSENVRLAMEITVLKYPNPNPASNPVLVNRELPQKSLYFVMTNDDEIYAWIEAISIRCPGMGGVSAPTNFSHRVHVGFDPTNGKFVGLPHEWERLLKGSAITQDDYQKHPDAVVEVLKFYHNINERKENPDMYPTLMPTPPIHSNQNMQLGHGGGGTAIAPPRPPPPLNYEPSHHSPQNSSPTSRNGTPVQIQQNNKMGMDPEMRRMMEEEARKVKVAKQQKEIAQAEVEQHRREQEAYNASIPKSRTPMAKQEIGGFASAATESPNSRYNPTRTAPPAPGVERQRQQVHGSLRAAPSPQRLPGVQPPPGPITPTELLPKKEKEPYGFPSQQNRSHETPKVQHGAQPHQVIPQQSLRTPSRPEQQRQPSPSTRTPPGPNERQQANQAHVRVNAAQTNGVPRAQQPVRAQPPPQTAAPSVKQPTGAPQAEIAEQHKQAEAALMGKGPAGPAPPGTRQKEVRMSSMTESQVMEKLKQVVSKDDPALSYSKQKKIGQGASGSVYVARINENATSRIASQLSKNYGGKAQVAIKQMDLRNQPRKELIVNEIIVMKESHHPNIVNFLDSFLQEGNNELWVVMEFMEGGALTDVIDNNPHITEAQISTICHEVSYIIHVL